ncbi:MAG: cell envelope-related transcriptional attenuator [Frankiales bacterium]|nr:cell envelope-related transcriptional attenuator [Frankiales bacterium]
MTEPAEGPADVAAGRRMALRRQRRRRRRQLIVLSLAVLVALTVALTVRLASSSKPPPAPATAQQRTQRTLLLQVQAPNGDAVATALLADDPKAKAGSVLLVPPQTLVTVPGTGSLTVSRALRSVPPEGSRTAVADALGVLVDGGWVIDQPSLARLVDLLGGITVDVDVPVLRAGSLVLSPGSQRVTGEQALVFLAYRAQGEQEQARLARVQGVLDGLLQVLPDTAPDTVSVLATLGRRSVPSVPLDSLAQLLVGLKVDDGASALQYDSLPVIPIDTGVETPLGPTLRIDPVATRAVVDRLLAGSIPPGGRDTGNRFLVLNGVGTPGLGEQVRAKLVPKGFVFVASRNAGRFGYARTQVLVPDATPQSQAVGARVAAALGLTGDVVRTSDQLGTVADVAVLVGADFRP